MSAAWTVQDSTGALLPHFTASSRLEVARKVVQKRYDMFRLQVSFSYREVFDRDVQRVLARQHWQIVPLKRRARPAPSMHRAA